VCLCAAPGQVFFKDGFVYSVYYLSLLHLDPIFLREASSNMATINVVALVGRAACALKILGAIVSSVEMGNGICIMHGRGGWSRGRVGSAWPAAHEGDFFGCFGGCGGVADDEDARALIPSVNGEYGAATEWGGARCPDFVRGGSAVPGHFFCSSCILSSGSPTMWYLSQLMGGHRTTFCGCGMGGNLGALDSASMRAESLRASGPGAASPRPDSVGVSMSWYEDDCWARCSWSDRAKAWGSATAAALSSSSALRSRLLFSRCSCRSDMAERRAMASGLSVSDMATEGGWGLKVAVGGGAGRGRGSVRSTGASWAAEAVGVRGDTGGRSGVGDLERLPECSEAVEASLDETGRVVVSTRSAGMAA
jgi:hypothetical protein